MPAARLDVEIFNSDAGARLKRVPSCLSFEMTKALL